MEMLKTELEELYKFIKRNWTEAAVISLATLFLLLAKYHPLPNKLISDLLYYFALPIVSILLVLRRNPLDFGLRLGNVKIWSAHLLLAFPIIFVIVYWMTSTSGVQHYYRSPNFNPLHFVVATGLSLFPWEFIFRGFLLFGLKDRMKETAVLVQMVPFTLLHLGKPEFETVTCIISGIYFGFVCYRSNSFWPAWLIHQFISYSMQFLIIYHFGA